MFYFRAFIAGIVLPTLLLPVLICILIYNNKEELLKTPFIHWLPIIWGIWNVFHIFVIKNFSFKNHVVNWAISGAILGFLVALYGVFWLQIPTRLGIEHYRYFPLVGAPIVYALLWGFIVKPLSDSLIKR